MIRRSCGVSPHRLEQRVGRPDRQSGGCAAGAFAVPSTCAHMSPADPPSSRCSARYDHTAFIVVRYGVDRASWLADRRAAVIATYNTEAPEYDEHEYPSDTQREWVERTL